MFKLRQLAFLFALLAIIGVASTTLAFPLVIGGSGNCPAFSCPPINYEWEHVGYCDRPDGIPGSEERCRVYFNSQLSQSCVADSECATW